MSIKLFRPPRDNKIRHFSRTMSDNDILCIQNGNQRRFSPSKLFVPTHKNRPQNKTVFNLRQDFEKPRINSIINNNGGKISSDSGKSSNESLDVVSLEHVMNNAVEQEVKNMKITDFEEEQLSNEAKNLNEGKTNHKCNCEQRHTYQTPHAYTSRRVPNSDGNTENNVFDVKDDEIEKLPDVDFPKGNNLSKPKPANATDLSSNVEADDEYGLSDVKYEDVGPLPCIRTPKRFQQPKYNTTIFQQRVDTPDKATTSKRMISRFKRSVSSIESSEDYTSFFGAIKNTDKRQFKDHQDDEEYNEPFYFNSYVSLMTWHQNVPTEAGSNLNRAYSAESFMKRKDYDNTAHAHSSRRSSSLHEEVDKGDQSKTDRLHMRRGALAEPEKMLMSQEIRERAQKDVERRKTLLRKVSQFFNLHLRLNGEEDLI